jgi:hypothetical protein
MVFFGDGDIAHHGRQFGETFFLGRIGETGIHVKGFLMFAGGGFHKVVNRIADYACGERALDFHQAAFKEAEKALGMGSFLLGGFLEDIMNQDKAVFFGLFRPDIITVAGLGLAGKCCQDIFFGLCAFK